MGALLLEGGAWVICGTIALLLIPLGSKRAHWHGGTKRLQRRGNQRQHHRRRHVFWPCLFYACIISQGLTYKVCCGFEVPAPRSADPVRIRRQ